MKQTVTNLPSLPSEILSLIDTLKSEIVEGQQRAAAAVEQQKLTTYWQIGKHIKLHLLQQKDRAVYGDYLFPILSEALGVEDTLLYKTVQFYESYPEIPAALRELTWTHIRSLLAVSDLEKRAQLEKKVRSEKLSTRQLDVVIKAETAAPAPGAKLTSKREAPYIYKMDQVHGRDMIDLGFLIFIDAKNRTLTPGVVTHYTYKAYVTEVIDGDTLWATIDLGFDCWTQQKLRLRGINSKPIDTESGQEAKAYIEKELAECPFIVVRTYWRDKFTRYLVDIFYDANGQDVQGVAANGAFLNQKLLDLGLALVYDK